MREQALRESSGAPIPVREVEDETQEWGRLFKSHPRGSTLPVPSSMGYP
jgi:hypothetical protein